MEQRFESRQEQLDVLSAQINEQEERIRMLAGLRDQYIRGPNVLLHVPDWQTLEGVRPAEPELVEELTECRVVYVPRGYGKPKQSLYFAVGKLPPENAPIALKLLKRPITRIWLIQSEYNVDRSSWIIEQRDRVIRYPRDFGNQFYATAAEVLPLVVRQLEAAEKRRTELQAEWDRWAALPDGVYDQKMHPVRILQPGECVEVVERPDGPHHYLRKRLSPGRKPQIIQWTLHEPVVDDTLISAVAICEGLAYVQYQAAWQAKDKWYATGMAIGQPTTEMSAAAP